MRINLRIEKGWVRVTRSGIDKQFEFGNACDHACACNINVTRKGDKIETFLCCKCSEYEAPCWICELSSA